MFNENDFETFQILSGTKNKKIDVKGIIGDVPAVDMKLKFSDLVIIYHETKDKLVDYFLRLRARGDSYPGRAQDGDVARL